MANQTCYEVLDLLPTATEDEINKARRSAFLKYHPDKLVGCSEDQKKEATEKFHAVSEACKVLLDPKLRANHDEAWLMGLGAQVFENSQVLFLQSVA